MKGSSRRTFLNKHILALVAFCAAIVVLLFLVPRAVGSVAALAITPVLQIEHWIAESSSVLPSYIRSRNELLAAEQELRRKLADHAAAALSASLLAKENDALRGLLSATTTSRIAAGVIGRPTLLPYDVFVIDRGTVDGVRQHAPVYAGKDQVIGFVAHAYAHTAVVTLVTTPDFKSTVYIYGPNIYTTAVGRGSGSLRVAVPQGITLTEGDLVAIPSLGRGVYGKISVIDSVPSRPEQYGYVSIEEPLAGIQFVSVGAEPLTTITFEEAKEIVEHVRTDVLSVPVPGDVLVDVESGTSTATTTDEL